MGVTRSTGTFVSLLITGFSLECSLSLTSVIPGVRSSRREYCNSVTEDAVVCQIKIGRRWRGRSVGVSVSPSVRWFVHLADCLASWYTRSNSHAFYFGSAP